jgi:hypothetical protein
VIMLKLISDRWEDSRTTVSMAVDVVKIICTVQPVVAGCRALLSHVTLTISETIGPHSIGFPTFETQTEAGAEDQPRISNRPLLWCHGCCIFYFYFYFF